MLDIIDAGKLRVTAVSNPFRPDAETIEMSAGLTISAMLEIIQPDEVLRMSFHVFIGPNYIMPEFWHVVRPKAGVIISIRAFITPTNGDILRDVLLVAVIAATIVFAAPLGAALGFTGTLAASVGQAVIGIGGMLLVNALVPPRTTTTASTTQDSPTNFIQGAQNSADPFGVVPVHCGFNKYVPKLGAEWVTEIVGDDQYLRGLLVVGVGPVSLDPSLYKIGDTLLSNFDNVQIETREGYAGDAPLTLYPNAIDQQNFTIVMTNAVGFTTRTSDDNADELSVDFVFPNGLINVADDGTRSNQAVTIEIEYAVAGSGIWVNIPLAGGSLTFDQSWTNASGGTFNQVTFTQQKTSAIRHGIHWKVPVRGQYDVRVKRLSADNTTSVNIRDEIDWTTLRRIENIDPINTLYPVAKIAIRIKATDQLNSTISQFACYPKMVAPDYDVGSGSWITRASQQPAAAFRNALQGAGLQSPYSDDMLDLDGLAAWNAKNIAQGFLYNQVRDFGSSLWDFLTDICAAGRASPRMVNGKYGVTVDEPKLPVQHITPRNSWDFSSQKLFVDPPHAFRIQFNNEEKDYVSDEVRVYSDGYDATNATLFETLAFPGVTSPALNIKHGRFALACGIQRPEVWTVSQDMERLVYNRGDVVMITHDVLLVGIASGRIKSLILDGGATHVIGIVSDENLPMDGSKLYSITVRDPLQIGMFIAIVTNAGDNTTAMFVSPILIASGPNVGDLFGFGERGTETDSGIVLGVEPGDGANFPATVSLVPYRTVVYDIDAGPIPPFNSNITPVAPVPDVQVVGTRSDETVLTIGPGGSLVEHLNIKVAAIASNIAATLDAQIRPSVTNEPFTAATVISIIANEISLGDVRTGEYVDVRLRWIEPGRQPGNWTTLFNTLIVGNSNAPQPLINLNLATFGGQAFLRWDAPDEIDVVYGGTVAFRHSTDPVPEWVNSTSIGNTTRASALIASLPLKPGTYIGRVFDIAGNQSTSVSIDTKQASVLTYAPVNTLDEASSFSGAKTNMTVDGLFLKLGGVGQIDDVPDIDSLLDVDTYGGTIVLPTMGTYQFAGGFDFLTVQLIRLTTRLNAFNALTADTIDGWVGDIDDRVDFDGDDAAPCDANIYVSLTDDDPASMGATWTPYQRLDSMEIDARGARFQLIATSTNGDYNIFIETLGIDAEQVT